MELIIDCSKPISDPDREKIVEFSPEKLERIARAKEALNEKLTAVNPQSIEERISSLENQISNIKIEGA